VVVYPGNTKQSTPFTATLLYATTTAFQATLHIGVSCGGGGTGQETDVITFAQV
jgi:hypothetical protein